jgi:hypothetical protein
MRGDGAAGAEGPEEAEAASMSAANAQRTIRLRVALGLDMAGLLSSAVDISGEYTTEMDKPGHGPYHLSR